MTYGLPYKGSKSKIAEWVVAHIPKAPVLVDIFAGGCAVTHAALLSGKFESIIANDISEAPQVFLDAVNGECKGFSFVPNREEFKDFCNASGDEAIRLLYSYGNDRRSYLWGKEIEPMKVACSKMLSAPSIHERRMYCKKFIREISKHLSNGGNIASMNTLQNICALERMERLERLAGIGQIEKMKVSKADYRDLFIPDDAVVYADPPYRNVTTNQYDGQFNTEAFDKWLKEADFPVIVSEYTCPPECVEICSIKKTVTTARDNKSGISTEKLFIQEKYLDWYKEQMRHL